MPPHGTIVWHPFTPYRSRTVAFKCWLVSSLNRIFPWTPTPKELAPPPIEIARNERFAFQAAMRLLEPQPGTVKVTASGPDGWALRIRRVGYVPVAHHNTNIPPELQEGALPGFVPDPLFDESEFRLAHQETHAVWISVIPDPAAAKGKYPITVHIEANGKVHPLTVSITVHDVSIEPRRDFRVTNWFYNDALLDFHGCQAFDERYWQVLPNYIADMVEHGQDTLYTPVFTPPLDGVKRPSQLLHVTETQPGVYRFDWQDVQRYVRLARRLGMDYFEWTHLFTQWGCRHAIRIYHEQGRDERLLWDPETPATDPVYRSFLAQFLPELQNFLREERLLRRSFFHVSDEPHADHLPTYKAAREMLREFAPWLTVMDAISNIEFARSGLTDLPIPSTDHTQPFLDAGLDCWTYYCCGQRGGLVQRLLDTPLSQVRMNGWLFYRFPIQGFLHWGYNYWYQSRTRHKIDPYTCQDATWWPGWCYGDPFMVYPGADGPVDSLRWEVFGHSLQDYALLQTLGIARDSKLLEPLQAFDRFPRDEAWMNATKHVIYRGEKG